MLKYETLCILGDSSPNSNFYKRLRKTWPNLSGSIIQCSEGTS